MKIRYRPEIDGLRAVAVLAVIFFHAGFSHNDVEFFKGGFIGVDVFFVISGYLITSIILTGLKQGIFSFSEFYERRARRILPVLFTVLLTTIPVAYLLLIPWQLIDYAKSAIATLLFVSNIFFRGQSGYFAQDASEMPLLHTWSLAIEEQFYILFPCFLLLIWKFIPRLLFPLLFISISYSLYLAETITPDQPDTSFFLLPARFWELMCGALLAKLESDRGRPRSTKLGLLMPSLGLGLIFYSILFFSETTAHPGYLTLIPVIGTMLIVWYCRPGETITDMISKRPIVFIGLISYSFYLWHYPIFAFLHAVNLTPDNIQGVLVVLISFSLSVLTYYAIEVPFRNKTVSLKKVFAFFAASITTVSLCATLVLISDGGLGKYRSADLEIVSTGPLEHGKYVRSRFAEIENRQFDQTGKTRVLIIGDSYGQDLVNAIYESGMDSQIQLSMYSIAGRCGNLFIDRDVSENIEADYRAYCVQQQGYSNPELRKLMALADVIWLASSWQLWQAELLPESIANISKIYDAGILILGRKDFGDISPYELIRIPVEERLKTRIPSSRAHLETNEYMNRTLDHGIFINIHELLCGNLDTCPIFDEDLRLISYDGNHLTPAGAKLLGEKLLTHDAVKKQLVR